MSSTDAVDLPYNAEQFEALIGVDGVIHQKASKQLSSRSSEATVFSLLHRRYGPPIRSSASLLTKWTERATNVGLLYLYCHSNHERIVFSAPDDELDTIAFTQDYEKSNTGPRCLVFLNGCHTVQSTRM